MPSRGSGYGMPALVYRGKPLVSVMRAKKHIGVYPFSPAAVSAVAGALEGHPGIGLDKGTIRFQPEHPLPDDVVRAMVLRPQGADRGLTAMPASVGEDQADARSRSSRPR